MKRLHSLDHHGWRSVTLRHGLVLMDGCCRQTLRSDKPSLRHQPELLKSSVRNEDGAIAVLIFDGKFQGGAQVSSSVRWRD